MGIGFGNGGGTKGRNSDWKIKSNSFLIEGEKRRYRVCKKINFIIWSDEDSPIRVEEGQYLLKNILIDAMAPVREPVAISFL